MPAQTRSGPPCTAAAASGLHEHGADPHQGSSQREVLRRAQLEELCSSDQRPEQHGSRQFALGILRLELRVHPVQRSPLHELFKHVRRRRPMVRHEGGDEHRSGDLLREQLAGEGDVHAAEAVADEHHLLAGREGLQEVQQRLGVVAERRHLAQRPGVDARRRQVRRADAVPGRPEPRRHLEPGPAAEACAATDLRVSGSSPPAMAAARESPERSGAMGDAGVDPPLGGMPAAGLDPAPPRRERRRG